MTFYEAEKKHKIYEDEELKRLFILMRERQEQEKEYKKNLREFKWLKKYIKKNVCPKINCVDCVEYGGVSSNCPLELKNIKRLRNIYCWVNDTRRNEF